MSFKVRGYIGEREYFLYRNDLIKCFFCDELVTPIDFMWQRSIEQIKQFQGLLRRVPDGAAGKIGNKVICKTCLGDLEALLPFKYTYDD